MSPAEMKIHQLIAALTTNSVDTRHQAVRELGSMGKSAVEPLIGELVEAEDNDYRWYVAMALSGLKTAAVGPLISAMKISKKILNSGAILQQHWEISVIPAIEPLIDAMASDDRQLRGFLSSALCRIGKPAVEPLTRRLEDADEIIRSCATLTLWQMGETGLPVMVDKFQEEQ